MILTIAVAATAALAAPTPAQNADIRCIGLLAIVANEQERGTGWSDYPALTDDGARYAEVVGRELMTATGRTEAQTRDLFVAAVAAYQRSAVRGADHPPALRAEVDRCIAAMKRRAPPPPHPPLPRCAAVMSLAYEAVKAREGMTAAAKDLATLASVLNYRARTELSLGGRSEAAVDAVMAAARAEATKAGTTSDDELDACATLAAPGAGPGEGH